MAKTIESTPRKDGFRMPGEFEPHAGTWMLWPERTDTWRSGAKPVQRAYIDVAVAISKFEPVTMCVSAGQYEHARAMVPDDIRVVEMSSNDAWMRDIGPSFVINDKGEIRGVDWGFNAWGGLKGGLYFPWDKDIQVKQKMMEIEQIDRYDAQDLILEGGAIAVDGEGTLITTEQCVLNPNRNPHLTKEEVEEKLRDYLNIEKIIWLKNGLANSETDGHVDGVVFFARPGEVVMGWTDEPSDPQHDVLHQVYEQLLDETDAKGRQLKIYKVQNAAPVKLTREESESIDFARFCLPRTENSMFNGTYINSYICNGGVILPAYDDPQDEVALKAYQEIFPDREIVQVKTKEVSYGGGNIHCITQQQPRP